MSSARWLVPAASSGAKFVDLHATVRCLRNLWSMPKTSARRSGSVPEMWDSSPARMVNCAQRIGDPDRRGLPAQPAGCLDQDAYTPGGSPVAADAETSNSPHQRHDA